MGAVRIGAALMLLAALTGCATTGQSSTPDTSPHPSTTAAKPTSAASRATPGTSPSTLSPETWATEELQSSCEKKAAESVSTDQAPILCQCYVQAIQSSALPTPTASTTDSPTPSPTLRPTIGVAELAAVCPTQDPAALDEAALVAATSSATATPTPSRSVKPSGASPTASATSGKPTCTNSQVAQWSRAQAAFGQATASVNTLTQQISTYQNDYQRALIARDYAKAQSIQSKIKTARDQLSASQLTAATSSTTMQSIDATCRRV